MIRVCGASMGRWLVALVGLLAIANGSLAQSSRSSAVDLSQRLAELRSWLGDDERGSAWQNFLQLDELVREVDKAEQADRSVVARSWGRFHSGASGLNAPRFQLTRQALDQFANELSVPMALRWAGQIEGAKTRIASIDDAKLQSAKAELIESANALDRFLDTGDYQRAVGWRNFLKWDDLQTQFRSATPDVKVLEGVSTRFFDGHRGLELPPYVRVRDALRNYVTLVNLQQTPTAPEQLAAQYDLIAADLRALNSQPSSKQAHEVGQRLDVMRQLGQLQELSAEIGRHFQQPNVRLRVSETMIARGVSRPVDETSPVNEMILGTHVTGTGRTVGQTSAELVPNNDMAMIAIRLIGSSYTQTIGRQNPVAVYSRGVTSIDARKLLMVTPGSLTSLAADAVCHANNTIEDIRANRRFGARLIEKIAWKQAKSQLPAAENEGARRAELRVERKFDQQVSELVAKANRSLQKNLHGELKRRGLIPDSIRFSTTDSHLFAQAVQAGTAQLASMSPPPAIGMPSDVVLQIHESMINNTAELAFAGLTLTDKRAAELVQETTGELPESLQLSDDKAPWSVSLDWAQPLTVEFYEGHKLRIAFRGRKFTNGDNVLTKTMEIAAVYDLQLSPSGVRMVRDGDLDVTFPGRRDDSNLSVRDLGFVTLMREKFNSLFKPVIEGEGVGLPERWKTELRLRSLESRDGWLTLGWN